MVSLGAPNYNRLYIWRLTKRIQLLLTAMSSTKLFREYCLEPEVPSLWSWRFRRRAELHAPFFLENSVRNKQPIDRLYNQRRFRHFRTQNTAYKNVHVKQKCFVAAKHEEDISSIPAILGFENQTFCPCQVAKTHRVLGKS